MTSNATAILDEAYQRLHQTGPEFEGWLSNHGPMAAEAMTRHGHAEDVHHWLDGYIRRLEDFPRGTGPVGADWQQALGDPLRIADWTAFLRDQTSGQPWRQVLATFGRGTGHRLVDVPLRDGVTDWTAAPPGDPPAALLVGSPNYLGALEDLGAARAAADAQNALLLVGFDPVPALDAPGVVVGESHVFESPEVIEDGMHRPKRLKMAKPAALAMAEMSEIPLESPAPSPATVN